jgi:uncharacterized membrane protein
MPTVIAAVGNTPYNIVLVLHILTAMAAMAPAFAHPFLASQSKALAAAEKQTLWGFMAANSRRIYAPSLIVNGLLGFALAGMSDKTYSMSQGWLAASFIIWIAMNGILHAVLIPAERAVAGGDDSATSKVDLFGAILSLLLIVMLYLMVFKPGQ